MTVRRLLAGALLAGLAVPALAAAPSETPRPKAGTSAPPRGMGTRVFARVDGPEISQAASPSPSPSATPAASASPNANAASSPSPELAAKARTEFVAWQSAKIDLGHYVAEAKPQFTAEFVADVSNKYLKPLGTLQTLTQLQKTTMQGAQIYVFRATCDKGAINMVMSWNEAGLVQLIRFVPSQT